MIRYILLLYEGAYNVQRERVEYWAGWDYWIEVRVSGFGGVFVLFVFLLGLCCCVVMLDSADA